MQNHFPFISLQLPYAGLMLVWPHNYFGLPSFCSVRLTHIILFTASTLSGKSLTPYVCPHLNHCHYDNRYLILCRTSTHTIIRGLNITGSRQIAHEYHRGPLYSISDFLHLSRSISHCCITLAASAPDHPRYQANTNADLGSPATWISRPL